MKDAMEVAEAIRTYGFAVRPFKGRSMLPLLVQGRDAVKLVPPVGRLKKYDVACFKRPNGDLVLHRVVRVCDGYYEIRGDNCIKSEKVPDDWILAVAEGVYLDGVYHPCSAPDILRYARRQKVTLPLRYLKSRAAACARRVLAPLKRKTK